MEALPSAQVPAVSLRADLWVRGPTAPTPLLPGAGRCSPCSCRDAALVFKTSCWLQQIMFHTTYAKLKSTVKEKYFWKKWSKRDLTVSTFLHRSDPLQWLLFPGSRLPPALQQQKCNHLGLQPPPKRTVHHMDLEKDYICLLIVKMDTFVLHFVFRNLIMSQAIPVCTWVYYRCI